MRNFASHCSCFNELNDIRQMEISERLRGVKRQRLTDLVGVGSEKLQEKDQALLIEHMPSAIICLMMLVSIFPFKFNICTAYYTTINSASVFFSFFFFFFNIAAQSLNIRMVCFWCCASTHSIWNKTMTTRRKCWFSAWIWWCLHPQKMNCVGIVALLYAFPPRVKTRYSW